MKRDVTTPISFQLYEIRPDGTEWHSAPQSVALFHHVAQSVIAGFTGNRRAAIAPDGSLLFGYGSDGKRISQWEQS